MAAVVQTLTVVVVVVLVVVSVSQERFILTQMQPLLSAVAVRQAQDLEREAGVASHLLAMRLLRLVAVVAVRLLLRLRQTYLQVVTAVAAAAVCLQQVQACVLAVFLSATSETTVGQVLIRVQAAAAVAAVAVRRLEATVLQLAVVLVAQGLTFLRSLLAHLRLFVQAAAAVHLRVLVVRQAQRVLALVRRVTPMVVRRRVMGLVAVVAAQHLRIRVVLVVLALSM